jgi:hypothetical protein
VSSARQDESHRRRLHDGRDTPLGDEPPQFEHESVLKADFFSRSDFGHYVRGDQRIPAARRDVRFARWWTVPLALYLAARERRALRALASPHATADVPTLLYDARWVTVRTWIDGRPMQNAQPRDPAYYRAARRLLVRLHRRGVAHNDLAKEQNWLVTPDGRPALIDFQLAATVRVSSGRGRRLRIMAREDLRHLLKHKRTYCPHALTSREKAILAAPALPARLWRATGKPAYVFITRRIFKWSDGEGAGEAPRRTRKASPHDPNRD